MNCRSEVKYTDFFFKKKNTVWKSVAIKIQTCQKLLNLTKWNRPGVKLSTPWPLDPADHNYARVSHRRPDSLHRNGKLQLLIPARPTYYIKLRKPSLVRTSSFHTKTIGKFVRNKYINQLLYLNLTISFESQIPIKRDRG